MENTELDWIASLALSFAKWFIVLSIVFFIYRRRCHVFWPGWFGSCLVAGFFDGLFVATLHAHSFIPYQENYEQDELVQHGFIYASYEEMTKAVIAVVIAYAVAKLIYLRHRRIQEKDQNNLKNEFSK